MDLNNIMTFIFFSDDKEALAEDKVRFDKLLHDASLSPNQILEQMGVTADLDTENGN